MESIQPVLAAVSMASIDVRRLTLEQKKNILFRLSQLLIAYQEIIIQENKKDLDKMDDSNPKKDRLLLNESRIKDLADSLHDIVKLEDPAGKVLIDNHAENGLHIQKISVPMGVVGVIYEARPNVTIDVAALCLYAGNAVVLRGGSDAEFTNKILVKIIHDTLIENGVDKNSIQLLPVDRKFVKELLEAVKYVDIIIPRGSQQLIDFVRENSKVPTIETGAGVCHTYVESTANLKDAVQIVINAKTQRPSVCNALDTIIVDEKIAAEFLPMLKDGLNEFNVTIFADNTAFEILKETGCPNLQKAMEENFGMEYLSQQCSVKTVSGFDEAVNHIRRYSSRHSEAILSTDDDLCNRFLNEVDAAAVYTNASTRFTDGGCFGVGAEIGISTQKLHARGPFALEKLTTEKWLVRGSGQIR